MSGTALYRALTRAGAPDEDAKEAAAELDTIHDDINQLKVMVAEIRVTNRIMIALNAATFLLLLKIALE